MIIQKALISVLLAPLSRIVGKLPQKARDAMFITGGIGLVLHILLHVSRQEPYRFLIFFAISCLFLGLMILGSLGGEVKPVRFNRFLLIPMLATGLFMGFSGAINNVNYFPDALLLLVAFPILYVCWVNSDKERIISHLFTVNIVSLSVFLALSFLLVKITPQKYTGFSGNPNSASYFLTTASVLLFVQIMYERRFSARSVLSILLFGIAVSLNYYTNSRSGALALIFSLVLSVVVYAITHSKKSLVEILIKVGSTVAVSVICIFTVLYIFQLRQWLPIPYYDLNEKKFISNEFYDQTTDQDPADEADDEKDGFDLFFDNSGYIQVNKDKLDATDKTADGFSTGRLSVWKAYAKDLNLFGHESIPEVYVSSIFYKNIRSTHMTLLQIAYESGIFAAVCYLALNIASGIFALIYGFKHKAERYALFPLIIITSFGALYLLESCRVAFWYYNTLMYYLAMFPLMTKNK